MGMSIPRKSDKGYRIFALAYFIPFDIDNLLLKPGRTADSTFEGATYSVLLKIWEKRPYTILAVDTSHLPEVM